MPKQLFIVLLLMAFSLLSLASDDKYEFETKAQEQRYRALILVFRCPTCQNQNLSDSNSMVSDDLKQIVYEKVRSGASDEEITDFMKQRYGEFILYQPELSQSNVFLWAGPFVFLILFFIAFFVWYRRNKGEEGNE